MKGIKRIWRNYNLSIVLFILFLLSWIGHFIFQWQEFVSTQLEHNMQIKFEEYLPEFAARTFENWQSEFLQLFTMVVLTAILVHKGSHESKDNDEEVTRKLNKIESMLKELTERQSSKRG